MVGLAINTTASYQEQALSFLKPLGDEKDLVHAVFGITSEAGEIADAYKASLVYGKPFDLPNVLEESGDILWFLNLLLSKYGLTLEDAMRANIAKLSTRYQDGYADAKALGRSRDLERAAIEAVLEDVNNNKRSKSHDQAAAGSTHR